MNKVAASICLSLSMACTNASAMDMRSAAAVPRELQSILQVGTSEPAPASALLTNEQLRVELVRANWRAYRLTMLVVRDASMPPRLLGLISRAQDPDKRDVSYHWYPESGQRCQASLLDLAGLEQMFRFAMNDAVIGGFRFVEMSNSGDGYIAGLTHAQLLERIAQERECTAGAMATTGEAPSKRWRTVSLEPSGPPRKSVVAARLREGRAPLAGATILFFRAPHYQCSGTTDNTGLATCELEDTHPHSGHDDHEEDDEDSAAPTLATYPGDVWPDVIVLPTTAVQSNGVR
jgi:hypothetical protein